MTGDETLQPELRLALPPAAGAELPLLPVRMLNEFVYCPRLAYLEWVQSEWADNAETIEGRFAHRTSDRPGGQLPAAAEAEPESVIHARSVTLSSETLGVIAQVFRGAHDSYAMIGTFVHLYGVNYDVRDDKRWRRVFKVLKGRGEWLQLSVFQCRLSRRGVAELTEALSAVIKHEEDHLVILDLGPAEEVKPRVSSLGKPFIVVTRQPVIV